MSIDPTSEKPLTLAQAAGFCPRRRMGKKPHVSTLYRWATRGAKGVFLETFQSPGGLCTNKSSLRKFFEELTVARGISKQKPRPVHDDRHHEAVELELKRRFGV